MRLEDDNYDRKGDVQEACQLGAVESLSDFEEQLKALDDASKNVPELPHCELIDDSKFGAVQQPSEKPSENSRTINAEHSKGSSIESAIKAAARKGIDGIIADPESLADAIRRFSKEKPGIHEMIELPQSKPRGYKSGTIADFTRGMLNEKPIEKPTLPKTGRGVVEKPGETRFDYSTPAEKPSTVEIPEQFVSLMDRHVATIDDALPSDSTPVSESADRKALRKEVSGLPSDVPKVDDSKIANSAKDYSNPSRYIVRGDGRVASST